MFQSLALGSERRRELVALVTLVVLSGFIYFYNLSINGWANAFYSGAAQAGSQSWRAWLYGSSDPLNAISVDKIPAALWIDGLSVRLFGLNSFGLLAPQALMGVVSVVIEYKIVRGAVGVLGGFSAGLTLALTPVAAEMFRFNNPDSLLVLLWLGATMLTLRALRDGTRWPIVVAGTLLGFSFLAKMLQGIMLVPVLAVVFLVASPRSVMDRLKDLLAASLGMVFAAGWYVLLVEITPPSQRPFVGGTLNNSILELTMGYNGFGRITGSEIPHWLVGDAPIGRVYDSTGIQRLFSGEMISQASWLIPSAVVLGAATLAVSWGRPRTDLLRAQMLIWLLWLGLLVAVFSFMKGVFHAYYTVALAPPVAGCLGLGLGVVWRGARRLKLVVAGCVGLAVGGFMSVVILARVPTYHPELKIVIALATLFGVAAMLGMYRVRRPLIASLAFLLALAAMNLGPASFTWYTMNHPIKGAVVVAGPALKGQMDRQSAFRVSPGRGFSGPGEAASVSQELKEVIQASPADWPVASIGATTAALFQLGSGRPTLAIGGYNGLDPSPTLAEFRGLVKEGRVHYLYPSSGPASVGTKSPNSQAFAILAWAKKNCPTRIVDSTNFLDLSQCRAG